jgi:hypothetical protein
MVHPIEMTHKTQMGGIVKWQATAIQRVGYGLTGLNVVSWNVFAFFIGIFLWFSVGTILKDNATMVVHVGAIVSLFSGYLRS